jgi:ribonuclease D
MAIRWIDDPDKLIAFCDEVDTNVIAVDTESDHFHAYQASVCLIQIAAAEVTALIDPLAIEAEAMSPMLTLLENPSILKLLHSARNDIMELDRDYGLDITHIYDTQIAAQFLAYERSALSYLLEELLGIAPGAKFQRFDWTTRPLPEGALHYATEDVVHLERLKDIFDEELDKTGWTRAFEQTCAHVARTSNHEARTFDPEGWRRIKSKKELGPRDRAALAALFLWRHELCLELNKAALFVLDNATMLRLAIARPTTPSEFGRLNIRQPINRHRLESLLSTIKHSLTAAPPPEKLPRTARVPGMSPAAQSRFETLKSWRNRTAEELRIPGEFIANNATLTLIASAPPASVAALEVFEDVLPWQREMFGSEIVRLCQRTG